MNADNFSQTLLHWYEHNGRQHLPWKSPASPYRVWLSEIMLQQTQVSTVLAYFEKFTQRFPEITDLAAAKQDEVMHMWSGLGYYTRARNLHRCAQIITTDHGGIFPNQIDTLIALPGIGRSTAGAILAQAFDQRHAILDGNVKRVLTRLHAIEGWPAKKAVENKLWQLAEHHTPQQRAADYTQAIMDFGATQCTRSKPNCHVCPMHHHCLAFQADAVTDYPHKKPKKTMPERSTQMLMVSGDGTRYLLEKRPPAGIWGGLWSFPECTTETELPQWCEDQGYQIEGFEKWPSFRHTFSHYHLHIHPVKLHIKNKSVIHDSAGRQCLYDPRQPSELGIATPIKQLLNKLAAQ